jgi:hypothetical protein
MKKIDELTDLAANMSMFADHGQKHIRPLFCFFTAAGFMGINASVNDPSDEDEMSYLVNFARFIHKKESLIAVTSVFERIIIPTELVDSLGNEKIMDILLNEQVSLYPEILRVLVVTTETQEGVFERIFTINFDDYNTLLTLTQMEDVSIDFNNPEENSEFKKMDYFSPMNEVYANDLTVIRDMTTALDALTESFRDFIVMDVIPNKITSQIENSDNIIKLRSH